MTLPPLNAVEQRVVELLDEGYARWKIAELMEVSETTLRYILKSLCKRYDCPARDLPQAVRENWEPY